MLRERLYSYLEAVEPEAESGFDLAGQVLRAGEVAGWLDRARRRRRRSASRSPARSAAAPARSPASRSPPATGRPPGSTRPSSTRPTSAAVAAWLADPDRPKVVHDAKPASLAARAHGWAPRRRPGRHRARGLPGQARPARLRPDRPGPALPQARAAGRGAATTASSPSTGLGDDGLAEENVMLRARATLDLADVLTEELSRDDGASQRLLTDVEQPLSRGAGRDGAARHRRRHRLPLRARGALRGRGQGRPAGRARGGRPRVQPGLAQAAAGDPVHRAEPAQDQADQVGLHHRRRRPAEPVRPDRRPAARAPAAAPRRGQAQVHGRRPAQVGLRRRPHPHHVQPDRGRHRPALVHRPQPAEHPDPHRGGPADPPRVRGRRRVRAADDRRLQPDRDAHHGAPVRRRGAHRRVQLGVRLPRGDRVVGLPRAGRGGRPRPAPQDQGDELRPRLRPVRVRPVQPAEHLGRRGQEA